MGVGGRGSIPFDKLRAVPRYAASRLLGMRWFWVIPAARDARTCSGHPRPSAGSRRSLVQDVAPAPAHTAMLQDVDARIKSGHHGMGTLDGILSTLRRRIAPTMTAEKTVFTSVISTITFWRGAKIYRHGAGRRHPNQVNHQPVMPSSTYAHTSSLPSPGRTELRISSKGSSSSDGFREFHRETNNSVLPPW